MLCPVRSYLIALVAGLALALAAPPASAEAPKKRTLSNEHPAVKSVKNIGEPAKRFGRGAVAHHWDKDKELLADLLASIKGMLNTQDPKTGRFGTKPWICRDQNRIYPMAAAWSIKHEKNPWYHNDKLLEAIMAGGDALVDAQDKNGMWTFRKKDNSTWGQIYMPWTYSRWIRAYLLIKDAMPPDRRAKWDKGLLKGFEGISRRCLGHVHNIPAHHAMALYAAGVAFDRDDWKKQAADFMQKVIAKQSPDGWWSEHVGPVVGYNFVYVDALGTYFAMSNDKRVLPSLQRAAVFHSNVTYPDGSRVETVDERNPYHKGVALGNVGFTMTPEGRGWLLRQYELFHKQGRKQVGADYAASMLLYGRKGKALATAAGRAEHRWISNDGKIAVLRKEPWYVVASGYTATVPNNRWIQDRQNFVSIFHDEKGLILGGGNTKLQPYWSNFTVGDPGLLKHKEGDTKPKFRPPSGLIHTPQSAKLALRDNTVSVALQYGQVACRIEVDVVDERATQVTYRSNGPWDDRVEGHVTLLPHVKESITSAGGKSTTLGSEPIEWSGEELGGWVRHHGRQLTVPTDARLLWPKLPHNPYKKAGQASLGSGRIVVALPISKERPEVVVKLSVPPEG